MQARITELHNQLEKLGGKQEIVGDATGQSNGELYPSIRKLPLLGVSYADLYRRMKVQEAVFETLTQEYELAKVAEAKEIPSVKVLDQAEVPERKAFPPRLLIMLLGTFFSCAIAAIWILVRARWEEISAQEPGKVLAHEVFATVNSSMPWATPNGSRFQRQGHRIWTRLVRRNHVTQGEDDH